MYRLHAAASVRKWVNARSRRRTRPSLFTGLAAGVSGMSHACVEAVLPYNAYLCISRGPFVLSRFLLVPFVFSSRSDTDLAIYGDGIEQSGETSQRTDAARLEFFVARNVITI